MGIKDIYNVFYTFNFLCKNQNRSIKTIKCYTWNIFHKKNNVSRVTLLNYYFISFMWNIFNVFFIKKYKYKGNKTYLGKPNKITIYNVSHETYTI